MAEGDALPTGHRHADRADASVCRISAETDTLADGGMRGVAPGATEGRPRTRVRSQPLAVQITESALSHVRPIMTVQPYRSADQAQHSASYRRSARRCSEYRGRLAPGDCASARQLPWRRPLQNRSPVR